MSAGDAKIYANLTDTDEVVEIDAKTATVARRWPTAPCKHPVAMAIDTEHHRLFSGCRSGVMAISDYRAGKIVATVPIGAGVDGAGYDAASGGAFASNADGTLTVIHEDSPGHYHVAETVKTPQGSRTLGVDPTHHRIFVASAKFGPPPASGKRTRAGVARNLRAVGDRTRCSAVNGKCEEPRWNQGWLNANLTSPYALVNRSRGGGVPSGFRFEFLVSDALRSHRAVPPRDVLHHLVDELPEEQTELALLWLEDLLHAADEDGPPLDAEALASLDRGLADVTAGRVKALAEYERERDL